MTPLAELQARLDEARAWAHGWRGPVVLGLSNKALKIHQEQCRDCQRIITLERQLVEQSGEDVAEQVEDDGAERIGRASTRTRSKRNSNGRP